MSTRMPPRGRGPQRPQYTPPAVREERNAPAQPARERRRVFDIVIVLVVVALVAIYIKVLSSPSTPANSPGATLNLGQTAKPGKANSGATAPAGAPVSNRPVITELMASNSGSITGEDGQYHDWIEIYNPTGQAINLAGFALSDNVKKPTKFVLPSYVLDPGKYVIVFADDQESTKNEIHANFKLKSTGQVLLLVDPNGNQLQSITYPAMETDYSYAMDLSSQKWALTDKYTPGFENTNEGYGAYVETRHAKADIIINEVMAGNTLTIKDGDGDFSDWVELYNPTDKEVDLTGWGLSNRESEPKRWVFPETKIGPKQYLVVYVSGKNRAEAGKELHANFRLNAYQDAILLSNFRGQIVSEVNINNLKDDESYAQVPGSDKWEVFTHPTPGYPNNEDGWNALQPKLFADTNEPIVISEIMSTNASVVKDQFDEYSDYVELHNRSNKSIDLKGYGLTDKSNELGRWKFPDITLDPGGYLTVYASGRNLTDEEATSSKKLHTDFNISGSGGVIALTAPDGHLADRSLVPALKVDMAYGRLNDSMLYSYITEPTPGAANKSGFPGMAPEPMFSVKAGIYDTAQQVDLTTDDPEAKIYYTTNGDTPTKNSTPYTGPIEVKKPDKDFGGTVIRAVTYRDGYLPGKVVSSTYLIGQEIDLPVLSIAVDNKKMFDPTTGMYSKGPNAKSTYPFTGANFWKDTELPAHMELIEPDGTVGISQDVGLQIAGQFSRGDVFKGLELKARSIYGKSSMDYQIFPDQQYASYKSIVSRPGGQDAKRTGMRDVLASSLARDIIPKDASGGPSVFVQNFRTALEFVNGEFWGVTHIREKIDEHTIAQHYPGVDESRIDLIDTTGAAKVGSNKDYKALIEYVKTHDLSNPEYYKYVTDRMDIDSYINFFTLELCSGNTDYGNIRLWRSPNLDNKWRWIFYDFCWTFTKEDRSDIALNIASAKASANGALIQALLKNPEFKDKFLKQLAYNINVTFETNNVLQRIDEIAAVMRPYMAAEGEKWHDLSYEGNNATGAQGYSNWENQVKVLRTFAQKHPDHLKQEMKNYFHLSDDQMNELFNK